MEVEKEAVKMWHWNQLNNCRLLEFSQIRGDGKLFFVMPSVNHSIYQEQTKMRETNSTSIKYGIYVVNILYQIIKLLICEKWWNDCYTCFVVKHIRTLQTHTMNNLNPIKQMIVWFIYINAGNVFQTIDLVVAL